MESKLSKLHRAVDQGARTQGPLAPRVNAYVCRECAELLFTVDVADGTTSMILPCMKKSSILDAGGVPIKTCSGEMVSCFYRLSPQDYEVEDITHEWYAPTVEEYNKIRVNKSRSALDHVTRGGLLLRERTDAPMFTHGGKFIDSATGDELTEEESCALATGFERLRAAVRVKLASERRRIAAKDKALAHKRSERKRKKAHSKRHG